MAVVRTGVYIPNPSLLSVEHRLSLTYGYQRGRLGEETVLRSALIFYLLFENRVKIATTPPITTSYMTAFFLTAAATAVILVLFIEQSYVAYVKDTVLCILPTLLILISVYLLSLKVFIAWP